MQFHRQTRRISPKSIKQDEGRIILLEDILNRIQKPSKVKDSTLSLIHKLYLVC
jgi:hypothetical protein